MIYGGIETLPTLDNIEGLTVESVIAMTRQR
jgi:hypothetical protein